MPKVTNGVELEKGEFNKEHKELMSTLKNPTKSKLRKQIKEQGEEMKEVKKQSGKGVRR